MQILQLVVGVLLVAVVFLDALATTLAVPAAAGPVTDRITGLVWRGLLAVHHRDSRSAVLRLAGSALLTLTVLVWVAALWAGWSLVFLSGGDTVLDATTRAPVGVADTVYFVGFTVFTLGVGDMVANGSGWRITTALASFTGLFLITLAITFLLSVVGAVVSRRALAVRIHALGRTSVEIVVHGWTGSSFSSAFVQNLVAITGELSRLAEQHLAYPVLHYFHTGDPDASAARAVAALDDAMLLLQHGVAPGARPDGSAAAPVQHAVSRYLETSSASSSVSGDAEAPLTPPLLPLREAGVPVVDEAVFAAHVASQADRRGALRRVVESDGWSWPDVEELAAPQRGGRSHGRRDGTAPG